MDKQYLTHIKDVLNKANMSASHDEILDIAVQYLEREVGYSGLQTCNEQDVFDCLMTRAIKLEFELFAITEGSAKKSIDKMLPSAKRVVKRIWDRIKENNPDMGDFPNDLYSTELFTTNSLDSFLAICHEAVHSIAETRKINDTSRNGRYHNANFEDIAKEMCLICDKIYSWGVEIVDITQDVYNLYKDEIEELDKLHQAYIMFL